MNDGSENGLLCDYLGESGMLKEVSAQRLLAFKDGIDVAAVQLQSPITRTMEVTIFGMPCVVTVRIDNKA